jgi:hypothetical protein
MPRFVPFLVLLPLIGCADPSAAVVVGPDAAAPEAGPPPTAMAGALAAVGLDVTQLPAFDELTDAQLPAVMDTFTRALGVGCGDCHEPDFTVATARTRIARKMWDRLVRGLLRRDGGALYCDSCHAGQVTFLDRSDPRPDGALGRWMLANYVTPLARRDGAPHGCATCHGDPFVGGFLDDWSAPDAPPDGAQDAGTPEPPPDLGPAPADGGVVGCESLLVCIDACAATDGKCVGACKRKASAAAKALLSAAEQCADDACVAAGRCHSAADDSADCNACFSNASAGGATGVPCAPVDDPICGACADGWLECESR